MLFRKNVLTLAVLVLLVFLSIQAQGTTLDFAKIKNDLSNLISTNNGEVDFSKIPELKGYALAKIKLSKTLLEVSPKDPNFLVLSGLGSIPADFKGLSIKKQGDLIVTLAPGIAKGNQKYDMVYTVNLFTQNLGAKDFYSGLSNPILEFLSLEKGIFTYASSETRLGEDILPKDSSKRFADILGTEFMFPAKTGITMQGKLSSPIINSLPFKIIKSIIRGLEDSLVVYAVLTLPPLEGLEARIALKNVQIPFLPKGFASTSPYIVLRGEPSLGIGLAVNVKLPPHQDIMQFDSEVRIPLKAADREIGLDWIGRANGIWRDAAGISGFNIHNMTIKSTVSAKEGGTSIGFGGQFNMGHFSVDLAAKVPAGENLWDCAYMGTINQLSLQDIAGFLMLITPGKTLPAKLPLHQLTLKDVEISVSNADDNDLDIKEGITYAGTLAWSGTDLGKIELRTAHDKSSNLTKVLMGFMAKEWIRKFKLGPLTVDGVGPDGKYGTADDGPRLDLAMMFTDQHYSLSGLIKLFSIEQDIEIKISLTSIDAEYSEKVFDVYESDIHLTGKADFHQPEFSVSVDLKTQFLNDLANYGLKYLNQGKANIDRAVNDAQGRVNSANADLEAKRRAVDTAISSIKNAQAAEAKLNDAQNHVNNLNRTINDKKNEIKHLKWYQKPKAVVLGTELGGLYTALGTANLALKAAKAVMSCQPLTSAAATAAKAAADAALKSAEATLAAANASLNATKAVAQRVQGVTNMLVSGGKNIFNITEAGFSMSLQDLFQGRTPAISIKGRVFGRNLNIHNVSFNFKDLNNSFLSLIHALFNEVHNQGEKLGSQALEVLAHM